MMCLEFFRVPKRVPRSAAPARRAGRYARGKLAMAAHGHGHGASEPRLYAATVQSMADGGAVS